MLDLAAWLLEQIKTDEIAAHAALERGSLAHTSDWQYDKCAGLAASRHISLWPPRRVLAECDAKRRIVELYRFVELSTPVTEVRSPDSSAAAAALLDVLKEFGAAYAKAGRLGYREEWRPVDDGWAEPFTDR